MTKPFYKLPTRSKKENELPLQREYEGNTLPLTRNDTVVSSNRIEAARIYPHASHLAIGRTQTDPRFSLLLYYARFWRSGVDDFLNNTICTTS